MNAPELTSHPVFLSERHAPFMESRADHTVDDVSCSVVRTRDNPAGDYHDPSAPVLNLQRSMTAGFEARIRFDREFKHRVRQGDMLLSPPDNFNEHTLLQPFSVDFVLIPVAAFDQIAAGRIKTESLGALHDGFFRDRLLEVMVDTLIAHDASGSPSGQLFMDHALGVLIGRLAVLAGHVKTRRASPSGPLSMAALTRVIETIEARLDQNLSLARLAGVLDMEVPAFSRAFRAATGQPPYQFVLARRVERARALVLSSEMSLAEIAVVCGFSSQQHMTDVFRSKLGHPPGRLRDRG